MKVGNLPEKTIKKRRKRDEALWIDPIHISHIKDEQKKLKKHQSNVIKKVKERQRRSRMTESIAELRKIVPACQKEKKLSQTLIMSLSVDYIRFLHKKIEILNLENELLRNGECDKSKLPSLPKEPELSFTEYQQQKDKELDEKRQLEFLKEDEILTQQTIKLQSDDQDIYPLNVRNKLDTDIVEIAPAKSPRLYEQLTVQPTHPATYLEPRIHTIDHRDTVYGLPHYKYPEHPQIRSGLPNYQIPDIEEVESKWPINYIPYVVKSHHHPINIPPPTTTYVSYQDPAYLVPNTLPLIGPDVYARKVPPSYQDFPYYSN